MTTNPPDAQRAGLRIIQLRAENLLRLKAVDIEPGAAPVVTISGRNAQGKTSVLNAISLALGGKTAGKDISRAVRDGETHAEVVVDLGDMIVTRVWGGNGATTLRVEARDGTVYRSPQKLLDGLVGKLSFDPLAFANQDPKDQVATLLGLVELGFDPDHLTAERDALYDERRVVGREKKQLEGQFSGLPRPMPGLPADEVSASDLINRVQAAKDQQRRTDAALSRVTNARSRVAQIEAELQDAREELASAEGALGNLPRPVNVTALEDQLAGLEETNAQVRAAKARADVERRLSDAVRRYEGFTESIDAIDEAKADGLAAAAMPIDGLSFDDDGVTYRGVPFGQASAAERLRVSLAIAMAANPDLRVIRITDGSLLDADSMRLIEQMAAEHGYQIWLEVVSSDESVGFHIEDGLLVDAPLAVPA